MRLCKKASKNAKLFKNTFTQKKNGGLKMLLKMKTQELNTCCPICRNKLYAYWHTPASDIPEIGVWYIKCTVCDYEVNEAFVTLEAAKEFKLEVN